MAKKEKHEEHENPERWFVSYADFMTLLFATFVVLYALAQSDVNAFEQSILSSQNNIMDGSNSLLEGRDGATNPIMLEYVSNKYEQTSYDSIKKEINGMKHAGVSASTDDRGLVIKFDKDAIKFASGSAEINPKSYEVLDKVAEIIKTKFSIHYIEVDGHTDGDKIGPAAAKKYPSNWELSSARASSVVRYLIKNKNFNPRLFTAVGYADSAPIVPNPTEENKAKSRRVEIVVLKNKHRNLVKKDIETVLKEAKIMQKAKEKTKNTSDAMQQPVGNDKELLENVIDISAKYQDELNKLNDLQKEYVIDNEKSKINQTKGEYNSEAKRLNDLDNDNYAIDGDKPSFME